MGESLVLFAQQVVETLGGDQQPDAELARQMQALSLAVHIPIVCFGIAFPAMFVFVEGLHLRTGDPTYKSLAKRWSKVALVLFAVGVVTGTILSFEFGLLWPNFMATFGDVFGIGFALEGISFFVEAIFIAIYVYGWDRLSPRAHFLSGVPVVISGFTGSFNVIAVNGWMNSPEGFDLVGGRVVSPRPFDALFNQNMWHEIIHMYLAGYIVCGFIVAGVYASAWLRGRRDHYHRTALVVALAFASLAAPVQVVVGDWAARRIAETQPVKLAAIEGLKRTQTGAPFTLGGFYDGGRGEVRFGLEVPKLLSLLAHHDPNAEVIRARVRQAGRPAPGQRRAVRVPDHGRDRHRAGAARHDLLRDVVPQAPIAALALVLPGGDGGRAAVLRRTDRGLDHDRGRAPAVDRLQGHAHDAGGHLRRRPRGRLRRARGGLRQPRRGGRVAAAAAATAGDGGQFLMLPELCLGLVMLGVTAYAVLGSADFGAGFWDLTAGGAERGGRVRGMIERSMSPVWEANHVWLIFVLVIVWTAFPVAFGSIFSTLSIPLFLAALGIIFRGTAFALRGHAATINEARGLGALFALSSVLIPFCLGAAVGGVASGRVPVGNAAGERFGSWLNPTSALIGVIAVLSGAYLAAVFLAGDSRRARQPDLVRAFRARALGSGALTGVVALGGLFVLRDDSPALYDGLTAGGGLAMVVVSALAGAVTLALVWSERYGLARLTSALAVAAIVVGWALAQDPYFLPGELTLEQAAAPDAVLGTVLGSMAVGALILAPSLWLLYRLTLQGRLDKDYEPLDQRFRP